MFDELYEGGGHCEFAILGSEKLEQRPCDGFQKADF